MSFANDFNYVDPTKGIVKEEKTMKKKIQLDSESDEEFQDDDSLADNPMAGKERYLLDFKNVVEGVFGTKSTDGSDHDGFISEVNRINKEVEVDEPEQVFTHVICNQYAKAKGIQTGDDWEKLDSMWDLYKTGKLPRLKEKKRKREKKSKYNFKKSKVVLSESEEDEVEEIVETGFYAFETLGKHQLSHLKRLESILDEMANKRDPGIKSEKRVGMHVFQDENVLRKALPDASLEFLKTNKGVMTTDFKKKPVEDFPQESSYGDAYGDEEEEDRVRWIDDVFEDDLEFQIEGHPNTERILLKLEAPNSGRAVKQIAMKCGSLFVQRYKRQPLEKDEESRNIYKNCHLEAMKDIYKKVKNQYVK